MKHFLFISLLFMAMVLSAQNVTYRYDAAGNRIQRTVTLQTQLQSSPSASDMALMNDIIAEHGIKIYPNPTRGMLSVEINEYSDDLNVEYWLSDMSGRIINHQKASSKTAYFDLNKYPAGIYLLKIKVNDETAVWKVVKE